MAHPQSEVALRTSNCSLLLIYLPRKDERLSRPGWLTYSGWFAHISGHPASAGRVQDSESSPQRPTFYHCATQPTIVGHWHEMFSFGTKGQNRSQLYLIWRDISITSRWIITGIYYGKCPLCQNNPDAKVQSSRSHEATGRFGGLVKASLSTTELF